MKQKQGRKEVKSIDPRIKEPSPSIVNKILNVIVRGKLSISSPRAGHSFDIAQEEQMMFGHHFEDGEENLQENPITFAYILQNKENTQNWNKKTRKIPSLLESKGHRG